MTRCKHCSYNYQIKSSAYNPTGECLEVQLSSYNAMTNHLRRILTAKSVVDSGKMDSKRGSSRRDGNLHKAKTPGSMRQQRLDVNSNSKVSHSLSQNDIDRLVYDTKHHPNDIANFTSRRSKHRLGSSNYDHKKSRSNRSNSTDSSDDSVLRVNQALKYYGKRISDDFDDIRKFGKSDLQVYFPRVKSSSEDIADFIAFLLAGNRSTSNITANYTDLTMRQMTNQDVVSLAESEDSSMYVKFVYDITKEVMDRGLYDDKDIDAVFQRHFKRNSRMLNKRRMKREINRLKKSLNMKCDYDSDEDETEEDEAAGRNSVKIIEKCEIKNSQKPDPRFSAVKENEKASFPTEMLIVTKEDILKTLLEMDLNPDKAREICDSLQNRSSPGIPRENRLPDGNGLRDSGLRNEETGNKLNHSHRLKEEENSGKEFESEDKKKNKKGKGISCDSGSDSEKLESAGSTDFLVVANKGSKTADDSKVQEKAGKDIIDVAMSEDSLSKDMIKVDKSDKRRSTSTAEDSGMGFMAGNGFDETSEAQPQGNPSSKRETRSPKKLEGGNRSREKSIPGE